MMIMGDRTSTVWRTRRADGFYAAFLDVGFLVAARARNGWSAGGYRPVLGAGGGLMAGTVFFYPLRGFAGVVDRLALRVLFFLMPVAGRGVPRFVTMAVAGALVGSSTRGAWLGFSMTMPVPTSAVWPPAPVGLVWLSGCRLPGLLRIRADPSQ